ncbi:PhnD/SsuA/transferrin family substrate-binding protein [Amaricoccus sp.]|uniref:PhnD/SsuA/transferrin family substrate-binding protein n=1 Tax=Amaricoccus sp. TaxID=1872485 RepID=UPI001B68FC4F|nr:PhnD/SsuA/transferrin family substrate-binding protein [Amaricoccus sp.]MBP7241905.1 PhnD/SsuA/transferrin family substrate-binding protein [Amaricoccus sp.]
MTADPVATLPMYDWPEVRDHTNALWAGLRDALRARGLAAPEALSRDAMHWTAPALALSQTCALPLQLGLSQRVTLIGAPDYGHPACPPGYYRSALVVRADDRREAAEELAAARFAYNSTDSQSGWGALVAALGRLDPDQGLATGAHRDSVRAVAAGKAEVAAIDAQSWRLALAWEPSAAQLRVAGWTRPTPGTPFVTAGGRDPAPFAAACAEAIATVAPPVRAALGLAGFAALTPAHYVD